MQRDTWGVSSRSNETLKSLGAGIHPIHKKGAQALAAVVKYDLKVSLVPS